MEQGKLSVEKIEKRFHEIDKNCTGHAMYEHNIRGEEQIIVVNWNARCYCYTEETLRYVTYNHEEFTWYKLAE